MKKNILNKTKTMVIRRKAKKIDIGLQIKDESVEQVDSFKCLGCIISSNLSCCQELEDSKGKRTF